MSGPVLFLTLPFLEVGAFFSACFNVCQRFTGQSGGLVSTLVLARLYLGIQTKLSYQRFLCGVPSRCDSPKSVQRKQLGGAGIIRMDYCCSNNSGVRFFKNNLYMVVGHYDLINI